VVVAGGCVVLVVADWVVTVTAGGSEGPPPHAPSTAASMRAARTGPANALLAAPDVVAAGTSAQAGLVR
jgi:hypothetical protein